MQLRQGLHTASLACYKMAKPTSTGKESKAMKYSTFVLFAVGAILALASQPALAEVNVNVSGYEVFLGVTCTINNEPATCGVQFGGWTGGGGAVPGGWTRVP